MIILFLKQCDEMPNFIWCQKTLFPLVICMPVIKWFCCVLHNLTAVYVHIGGVLLHLWPVTDGLENCFAKGAHLKWVQTVNKIRLFFCYISSQILHLYFEQFLSRLTIWEFYCWWHCRQVNGTAFALIQNS